MDTDLSACYEFYKIFTSETRLRLLILLRQQAYSRVELVKLFKGTDAELKYHLHLLEQAGLITGTAGQGPGHHAQRFYRLNPLQFRHSNGLTTFRRGNAQVMLPETG